ncbi:hypothetical protein ARSEF4850_001855 [Beauveria asiatica]
MTFLSEPPSGLPFLVSHEWRQKAPRGCRNPKKLRVEYWEKYNHAQIPLRSTKDWFKLALKVAEEARTPEELERGLEAEYYNELKKQLELARTIGKKGRDGDSYNLQRATTEMLDEKALASLLHLCSCLLYGWAEPDRSKKDMAEEEEAYLHRALEDPSLPLPCETQHISLTKDGEDVDTSDNAIDTDDFDEFGPCEAPFMRDDCSDSIDQLRIPYPAYSIDVAAEKNSHAEPALSAGTVVAHKHAQRDTARSAAESAQPLALSASASSSEQEPSSLCNQSMTNKTTPPSPPSTASPRSDSGAGTGCRSHNEESQPRQQQPTSPASVTKPAATKKRKCGESVEIADGKCSDHTNSGSTPMKSTRRKRSRSESPCDADIEDQRSFKRRSKLRK